MGSINPQTHRLTTIKGPRHPNACAGCGQTYGDEEAEKQLTKWQEHDHNDEPEIKVVLLCKQCGDRLIEQHPRLYTALDRFLPFPGAMVICGPCKWRRDLNCACPLAKINGGPGMKYQQPQPTSGFIDGVTKGRRWGRRFFHFEDRARGCTGFEA